MDRKQRKELQPIDAFAADNDQTVMYASIMPDGHTVYENSANDSTAESSPQQQQPHVIYAELANTQPPVVNADNTA